MPSEPEDTGESTRETESDWGTDDDLEFEDLLLPVARPAAASTSQGVYAAACNRYKLPQVSHIRASLETEEVVLRHHVLGPQRIKMCAIALVKNHTVRKLHLHDNDMGQEGALYISDMLLENDNISDLAITDNNIGRVGLRSLAEVVRHHYHLIHLDLSGNKIQDEDVELVTAILDESPSIRTLRLNHNNIQHIGASCLGLSLGRNDTLEVLDVSWNHITHKGATQLCRGLQSNSTLLELDLSWNGLSAEGCDALAEALVENHTLRRLDLSWNRIDMAALTKLLRGIKINTSLHVLRLAGNPLPPEGAMAILTTLDQAPDSSLQELNIQSLCVPGLAFQQLKESLELSRGLSVVHGPVLDGHTTKEAADTALDLEDPMTVLLEFTRLSNFRLVDLFTRLDRDGSKTLTHDEFRDGLLKANIPMSRSALDKLVAKLDKDSDGEVDFAELMTGQKTHKTKVHRMKQREKGLSYEDTEIGRVNTKLRRLLSFRRTNSIYDDQPQEGSADVTDRCASLSTNQEQDDIVEEAISTTTE